MCWVLFFEFFILNLNPIHTKTPITSSDGAFSFCTRMTRSCKNERTMYTRYTWSHARQWRDNHPFHTSTGYRCRCFFMPIYATYERRKLWNIWMSVPYQHRKWLQQPQAYRCARFIDGYTMVTFSSHHRLTRWWWTLQPCGITSTTAQTLHMLVHWAHTKRGMSSTPPITRNNDQ